ncbi:MAG: alkaline phosphatase family protein [Candidatus Cybelea sp.]
MQYRAAGLLFFLIVVGGGIVACSGGSSAPNALLPLTRGERAASGSTPISHVVVIIQENRSFDNFFADFPGANGSMVGYAKPMPSAIAQACADEKQQVITRATTVPLTEVSLTGKGFPTPDPSNTPFGWNQDLPHSYRGGYLIDCDSSAAQPNTSNPCKMDGNDVSFFYPNGSGPPTCTYTYQYVNPKDIQPYWDMAKQYALADNAFQTQGSESFTAHQDLIAGGTAGIVSKASIIDDPSYFPWGCDGNKDHLVTNLLTTSGEYLGDKGPFPCLTYPSGTIRDLLDAKSITWKFYANKVYPYTSKKAGYTGIWSAFDAIEAVRKSKEWGTKVTWPDTKIFNDVKAGQLPSVSWITPNAPNSDHPNESNKKGPADTGPSWVASIVNAIGESQYWKSTAIVVLWDDWGGYYDHVPPPFYDQQGGLGFRFPMIIISPFVTAHVEHTQYETTSVLKFIETNWNLGSLDQEDGRATSIGTAFNFNQSPRPFKKIPSKYPQSFFLHQQPSGVPPDSD